jgi:16S rRNA (cytidine1402-2'-O)-methyltransferase
MPLFVVATPIGNLEDLTFRALRVLREADLIAAEDTRRTAKLLAHYNVRARMVSLREHNEARETPRLLEALRAGQRIALVSDAGTPAISDPGAGLIRAVRAAHLPVIPIPGPSAVTAALSVAGHPAARFTFLGFPPSSGAARRNWIDDLVREPGLAVLFEAPHRIQRTLSDLSHELVNRPILVCREISKMNEEFVEYQNVAHPQPIERGEFTVVVSPIPRGRSSRSALQPAEVYSLLGRLTLQAGFAEDEAVAIAAKWLDLSPERVRRLYRKALMLVKRHIS